MSADDIFQIHQAKRERANYGPVGSFDWPVFVNTLRTQYMEASQQDLAQELGVSVTSVSNWERGRRQPQPRHRRGLRILAARYAYSSSVWPSRRSRMQRRIDVRAAVVEVRRPRTRDSDEEWRPR